MHLVDLEFSEVLEQENSVLGGFSFSKDVDWDWLESVDIDFDVNIDLDIDKSQSIEPDTQFWLGDWCCCDEDYVGEAFVSLYVGDPLIENH